MESESSCVGESACALPGSGQDDPPAAVVGSSCSCGDTVFLFTPPAAKPFLGGYRHKQTQLEYHHACCQTVLTPEQQATQQAATSCSTQTVEVRSHAVQSMVDAGTQVPRPCWYQDMSDCRTLESSATHQTAVQWLASRQRAAQTLQRCWRGCLGRRRAAQAAREQAAAAAAAAAAKVAAQQQAEEAQQYEIQRRMQPRRRSDFELLYEELAAWWGQETDKIRGQEGASEKAKHAALQVLLAKETRLLQTVEKLKLKAAAPIRAERVGRLLSRLAAPKHWVLPAGTAGALIEVEVETPDTRRAAELGAAYQALLSSEAAVVEARLAALLTVKRLVKEFDVSLCREIVGLADREADLIQRGRSKASMAGLRQRLANRFLCFIQTPAFNPAAAALQTHAAHSTPALQGWPAAAAAAASAEGAG